MFTCLSWEETQDGFTVKSNTALVSQALPGKATSEASGRESSNAFIWLYIFIKFAM